MVTGFSDIIESVKKAGVIGAGGGGFPSHVKLKSSVKIVIANGSECEPLLWSDKAIMLSRPDYVIEGIRIVMKATGAEEGVIALKGHYVEVVEAIEKALPRDGSIRIHLLENYYPAGDEFLLVYEVTGKIIPEGGIPLNIGVLVNNVTTLVQIAEAVNGKPVTERYVTVAGEFLKPGVYIVPIGTTYSDLINMAGGKIVKDAVLLDGGPMMGKVVNDDEEGIGKTTGGIIALPPQHMVLKSATRSIEVMAKLAASVCCQCLRCSDLCPRSLIGHEIFPHMTMRTIGYPLLEGQPSESVTSAFLCSQCGVCELFACDIMQLSPRKIMASYKQKLLSKGIKNPHTKQVASPRSQFNDTKVPLLALKKKIGVEQYDIKPVLFGKNPVSRVKIPITRHTGSPSIPTVKVGEKVHMGDIIATPPEGKPGAFYHASISGIVSAINEKWVEIRS